MSRPTVLITGAAKRLGAAMARRFGMGGWHVIVHCNRSRAEAEVLAARLPSAEVVSCDLGEPSAAMSLIADLAEKFQDWRLLINSASIFRPDDAMGLDPATHEETMRINSEVPVRMAQAFLLHAKSTAGRRIIQLTDQKLANPNPDFFSYTMSKHALAATIPMMAMAGSAADRIYGLAPGAILPSYDQSREEFERSGRLNLLQRLTMPEEIAEAAWFLAQGSLASGETIYVDSGQHLLRQGRDVLFLAREGDME